MYVITYKGYGRARAGRHSAARGRRSGGRGVTFCVVWSLIACDSTILLSGFHQPLSLVVVAAALSGGVMFIYSILLLVINRRFLPDQLKVRGIRMLVLLWAAGLFGVMSVLVVINEATG